MSDGQDGATPTEKSGKEPGKGLERAERPSTTVERIPQTGKGLETPGSMWDAPKVVPKPPPPPFSTSLPEIEPLPRPRRMLFAGALLAVCAVIHVWLTYAGVTDSGAIRKDLADQLADEAVDFSEGDVQKAVNVLFGVANGIGVLLLLAVIYYFNSLLSRRDNGRAGFTVMTLLFTPTAAMNMILRQGDNTDLFFTLGGIAALLVAVLVTFTEPVSGWLHQLERTHRISMDPATRRREVDDQATSD